MYLRDNTVNCTFGPMRTSHIIHQSMSLQKVSYILFLFEMLCLIKSILPMKLKLNFWWKKGYQSHLFSPYKT